MENEKKIITDKAPTDRQKRVKRMKVIIITIVVLLLILPSIICIFLMFKVSKMEKKLEFLTQIHEEEYVKFNKEKDASVDGTVVYAAEKELQATLQAENITIKANEKDLQKTENEDIETDNAESQIEQKKIYLTFDDGPSEYTNDILDVLKTYNVKATFFVIGKTDADSRALYKRIVEEGHTLGMHSYSHKYQTIYNSVDDFKKDMNKLSDLLYDVTGVRPKYYRFPGGSSNQVSQIDMTEFISFLNKKNIVYYDWNVENGDATGEDFTAKQLVSNIMAGIEKHTNSVVLMHDTDAKENTVKSLLKLIKELKDDNYMLLPIDENSIPIQHIKSGDVPK